MQDISYGGFSRQPKSDVPDSWEKKEAEIGAEEKFFMKTSIFKKFFIFSMIFFVLALVFSFYMFFFVCNTVSY